MWGSMRAEKAARAAHVLGKPQLLIGWSNLTQATNGVVFLNTSALPQHHDTLERQTSEFCSLCICRVPWMMPNSGTSCHP
jgi:hypothetical protein